MVAAVASLAAAPSPARARVLTVGPGGDYARPSAAARAARDGDEVRIDPGIYYDCAIWRANDLVIAGSGPATVLSDSTCEGKAIFIIAGNRVTVRDLTLQRVRVPDGNGAGIRAEGHDLRIERVRFINDEVGLLAAEIAGGTIAFIDSSFDDVGQVNRRTTIAAVMVGAVDRLVLRHDTFTNGKAGIAVLSSAAETDITDSRIDAPKLPSGATVQINGGLDMAGTTVQPGPVRGDRMVAVQAFPAPTDSAKLILRRNRLDGRGILLLNWSGRTATLAGNDVGADGVATTDGGVWSYRARTLAHETYDTLHHLAGRTLRLARHLVGVVYHGVRS